MVNKLEGDVVSREVFIKMRVTIVRMLSGMIQTEKEQLMPGTECRIEAVKSFRRKE